MQTLITTLIDNDFEITRNLQLDGAPKRQAEEQLFTKYAYFVREGMHKYSITEEDAFDAYSDAILSAIDTIIKGNFENRSTLKTYLFKIFHNKCVDIIRKRTTNKMSVHRTSDIELMTNVLPDAVKNVVQKLIEQSDHRKLREELEKLGDKCRQLLSLFAEDYSDKEIAQIAGYKTGEVAKTSRIRCLEKLRQAYRG